MRNAKGEKDEGNKFKRMTEKKMRPCSGGMGYYCQLYATVTQGLYSILFVIDLYVLESVLGKE